MFRKTPLLVLVLVAAAVGYAAGAASKLDEPMTLTPRLLAQVVCAAKSDDVVTFAFDGERDVVVATITPAMAAADAASKFPGATRQRIIPKRAAPVLSFIQQHVSPSARLEIH